MWAAMWRRSQIERDECRAGGHFQQARLTATFQIDHQHARRAYRAGNEVMRVGNSETGQHRERRHFGLDLHEGAGR